MLKKPVNTRVSALCFYIYRNNIGRGILKILRKHNFLLITIRKGGIEMELQTRVKEHLAANGIRKNHLAFLLGIYPAQLSQWLSGNYKINNSQIKTIEDFLSGKS